MNNEQKIALTKETYKKTAKHYNKLHSDVKIVSELLDYFIDSIKNIENKQELREKPKILDIGCGTGRDANYYTKKGFEVIAIDFCKEVIEIAKACAPKAKFLEMDMRNLKFENESFDGISMMASFLHIPKNESKKVLEKVHEILKKNGILMLAVKNGNGEKIVSAKRYLGNQKFFAYYNKEEIIKLLSNCGFEVIKLSIRKARFDNVWINLFARKI